MSMTTDVDGAANLDATTREAIRELENMSAAANDTARVLQLRAASNAPKLSGALSQSIRGSVQALEVVVTAGEPYAGFVEFGTRNMSAQPYMAPALADSQTQVVALYARDVSKAVGSIRGT